MFYSETIRGCTCLFYGCCARVNSFPMGDAMIPLNQYFGDALGIHVIYICCKGYHNFS